MRDDIVDMHHVGILVVQVEQIDLVRDREAIEYALLGNRHVEAERPALDHACAHTAAGALAAYDQAVDAFLLQQHLQRRAAEGTGALLVDDALPGLGREVLVETVVIEIGLWIGPGAFRIVELGRSLGRAGGMDNRNAGPATGGEQSLGGLDRVPGILAASRRELLVELADRP